jgi:hypothetical protein
MIPPIMIFSIQVHSGRLDRFHLPHGVKLQIGIQLLHPCLCCHLGRTIKVWDLYLPCSLFKLKVSPVLRPRLISELELAILIEGHLPLNHHIQAIVLLGTSCHLLNKIIHMFLLPLLICERGHVWPRVSPATHQPIGHASSMASL